MKRWKMVILFSVSVTVSCAFLNFKVSSLDGTNSNLVKHSTIRTTLETSNFQISALPESYISILTSIDFITLIICFLSLCVLIIIIVQFIVEMRKRTKEKEISEITNENTAVETGFDAVVKMNLKSISPIIIGLCIVMLIQLFTTICFLIFSSNSNMSIQIEGTSNILTTINFISTAPFFYGQIGQA